MDCCVDVRKYVEGIFLPIFLINNCLLYLFTRFCACCSLRAVARRSTVRTHERSEKFWGRCITIGRMIFRAHPISPSASAEELVTYAGTPRRSNKLGICYEGCCLLLSSVNLSFSQGLFMYCRILVCVLLVRFTESTITYYFDDKSTVSFVRGFYAFSRLYDWSAVRLWFLPCLDLIYRIVRWLTALPWLFAQERKCH